MTSFQRLQPVENVMKCNYDDNAEAVGFFACEA
jgi:hypothetical protein